MKTKALQPLLVWPTSLKTPWYGANELSCAESYERNILYITRQDLDLPYNLPFSSALQNRISYRHIL